MTETIELRVDGDSIDIEVESLGALGRMRWATRAPSNLKGVEQGDANIEATEELLDYLINLTTSQTILTRELINELPQEELNYLFNSVVKCSFEDDPDIRERGADQFRATDDETTLFDDGSVDLDDWR